MDGYRHSATSADGTRVGLLTAGEGPPLLLVHMPREAQAIAGTDLTVLAAAVQVPVLLILGAQSPAWAHDITRDLAAALPQSTLAVLDGQGHEAIETVPGLLVSQLAGFFRY
jgi:pimeloyl-ACP methyl ester carboxylesterase